MKKNGFVILFVIGLVISLESCISTDPFDDYISADPDLPWNDVEMGSSFDIFGPSIYIGYVAIKLYEPDKFLVLVNQNDKITNKILYYDRTKVLIHVNNLCKTKNDNYLYVTKLDDIIFVFDANEYRSRHVAKQVAEASAAALYGFSKNKAP